MTDSIARRSLTSVAWNSGANLTRVFVLFLRAVILARLLPIEVFGTYAGAYALVSLTATVAAFGLGGAFLHRAPQTEDEDRTAATWLSLMLVLTSVWMVLMVIAAWLFFDGPTQVAVLLLVGAAAITKLADVPRLILVRRVVHRRLAVLDLLKTVLAALTAVILAINGAELWALLSVDLVSAMVMAVGLYLWRPVWRPHLAWPADVVRHLLGFGARHFVAVVLLQALDRLDDLWSRFYLGAVPTGLYSRAYAFAIFPRNIIATPVNAVMGGAYAELAGDRLQLSRSFFRANAALIRTGFLIAGVLALAAPELIALLLGARWMPMLDAFRLMLVFTLLDPVKLTVANLFVAVGRPQTVVWTRLVQLGVLVAGLTVFGPRWGIVGVAVAVNLMLTVGLILLLWQARRHVDFSMIRLFAVPGLALATAAAATLAALHWPWLGATVWHSSAAKVLLFPLVYCVVLFVCEREQLRRMWCDLVNALRRR